MSQSLKDYVWVFVGCGGTFYAASPYLAVLRRRYAGKVPILIDPGQVDLSNHDRQWPGCSPGVLKVVCASECLGLEYGDVMPIEIADFFNPADSVLDELTNSQPVLAIVNVDNDRTRLDVADWLASRVSPGIMVVSGCERTFGQCYPGVWMDGVAVHDWRDHHSDVGTENSSMPRCNLQDIQANALTGVCVGMCVEEVALQVEAGRWVDIQEFYWERPLAGPPKLWSMLVMLRGGDSHG